MEIVTLKWIILCFLFVSTAVFSMLPMLLTNCIRYRLIVSLLSCFAGGVFMATGLLDIFPEVNEALEKASWGHGYPVAEFFVAIGFFLVLTVEQIVLHFKEGAAPPSVESESDNLIAVPRDDLQDSQRFQGSLEGVRNHPLVVSTSSVQNGNNVEVPHSSLRALLLAGALSLHSVFEGLAIGLQTDQGMLMQIFIAVSLHKLVIAFSLGLNLVQSELNLWTVIESNLAFCLASPLGLGLALGLERFGESVDSSVVNGMLQGLACGTFFYVTFFEVLPYELNAGGDRLLKLLTIIVGFSLVSGVLFLEPEKQSGFNGDAARLPTSPSNFHLL